ncbi:unnamed protein product [Durusdinium trenchii]|uniref:Uncharacterized protein n=1 Tax=Durusdinium trenchii TaxID=1381693 RepID=A0ABP0Q7P3_9DINO
MSLLPPWCGRLCAWNTPSCASGLFNWFGKADEVDGCCHMFDAVEKNSLDALRHFLSVRPHWINQTNDRGCTALHAAAAAEEGNAQIVELLLAARATVNLQDKEGNAPLHAAAEEGNSQIVELLLATGATVNLQDKKGEAPLHKAARSDSPRIVELLLATAATVNLQDEEGRASLHAAAEIDDSEVIQPLLAAGATVNLQDTEGNTPLHVALLHMKLAKLRTSSAGHTSEHSLSRWEQSSGYNERLLVAAGAKVHLLNQTGKSAWDIAEQKKQVNCLALFRELPVSVSLLSGKHVLCSLKDCARTVKELQEEAQLKLGVHITCLFNASGEKLSEFLTLPEAGIDNGDSLQALVMVEPTDEEMIQEAPTPARAARGSALRFPLAEAADGGHGRGGTLGHPRGHVFPQEAERTRAGSVQPQNAQGKQGTYDLEDPQQLVQFILDANVGLIRLEYLMELCARGQKLRRRQETETEMTSANQPAIVAREELASLEYDEMGNITTFIRDPKPRRVKVTIASISHVWESMEHPDPWGFQLHSVVERCQPMLAEGLVWIFFDYSSLYQYGNRTAAQEQAFRTALEEMHTLYAHEAVQVHILDCLTPKDWRTDGVLPVFAERRGRVTEVATKKLKINITPYASRGWCQAEQQWASLRSSLSGCIPLPPHLFKKRMDQLKFTHRSDTDVVAKLQAKVFEEKVASTKNLMVEDLDEEGLEVLCEALPFYKDLDAIVLNGIELGRDAALAAAGTDATSMQLESCSLTDADIIDIVQVLKGCKRIKELRVANNHFGDEGQRALVELSSVNPGLKIDVLQ